MLNQLFRARNALIVGLCVFGILVGCNMFALPFGSGSGTGSVRLLITDKPYPYEYIEEATVTITEINVRRADADDDDGNDNDDDADDNDNDNDDNTNDNDNDNANPSNDNAENANSGSDDDDDDEGGFVTIFEGEREFNLLELRNGQTDLLADTDVPAGSYDEMRLVVTRGVVRLSDDREFDLRVPSGSSSGIKLKFSFDVEDGEETTLLLDVDLSRAFRAIPSGMIDDVSTIREFQFRPSLAMRLINLLEAGSISGTVQDGNAMPIGMAAVTAYDDEDAEVTSTATEEDGTFMLFGLPTGTYRVEFSADGFEDAEQTGIDVMAENDTALGIVTLTATP